MSIHACTIVKDETDDAWDGVLRLLLAESAVSLRMIILPPTHVGVLDYFVFRHWYLQQAANAQTCQMAYPIDSIPKRIVLIRFLRSGLPRTAPLLAAAAAAATAVAASSPAGRGKIPAASAGGEEGEAVQWYIDDLFQPTVAVGIAHTSAER